ncbi:MAG: hypothetical protein IJT30_08745 [Muribaculaceae bacterium]|nr:hypothetical protein [Muribaculaceae bacterium]
MKIFNKLFRRGASGSVKDDFTAFLKHSNCDYNMTEEPEDNQSRFVFDYQAGHFVAVVKGGNVGVEVTYPSFFETPPTELQLVRAMCNHANQASTIHKYVYTFDEEDNCLRLHLSFFCNIVNPEQMTFLLKSCFFFQRDFVDDYKKSKEGQSQSGSDDVEASVQAQRRERELVALQEEHHDPTRPHGWHTSCETKHLTMNDFIVHALNISTYDPRELVVVRDGVVAERIADGDLAREFDLARLLVEGEGKEAILAHDNAVVILRLRLWATDCDNNDNEERVLTITALPDGSDDKSLYMRLTACLSATSISRTNSLASSQLTKSVSVLAAYDRVTDKQRQQEFDYMWKDARIKIRDGEKLTEQQQLIYDVARSNIAYNLYWGKTLMLNNRYYEALLHFRNAYRDLLPEFFNLSDEVKSTFMDLCYNIGFCYNELHQYEKAFYYLHFFDGDRSVRTVTEWVNCLANGRDIRVFKAIDDCLSSLTEQYKNADDVPDYIASFINFLRRRRAYALVDFNDLDAAEKVFKEMLEEPENSDYALDELRHIARLREQHAENALPDPATATDNDANTNDTPS